MMAKYYAILINEFGEQSSFELSIQSQNLTGTMLWKDKISNLIKVSKSQSNNAMLCHIKFNLFSLKCSIEVSNSNSIHSLTVITTTTDSYNLSETDYTSFVTFLDNLSIPISSEQNKLGSEKTKDAASLISQ